MKTGPIAATIERHRLEHRERRIARVIEALRERERALGAETARPAGLLAAIRDYESERRKVARMLADLDANGRTRDRARATLATEAA